MIGAVLSFFGVILIIFFSKKIFNARSLFSQKYIERNSVANNKPSQVDFNIKLDEDSLEEIKSRLEKQIKLEV